MSVTDVVAVIGWVSATAGAMAYLLVSRGRWNASSVRYQCLNLFGASLMMGVAAFNHVWSSAAANAVWALIGAQALWMIVVRRRRALEEAPVELAAEPVARLAEGVDLLALADAVDEVLEERDPTLRMSADELAVLTRRRGVAA